MPTSTTTMLASPSSPVYSVSLPNGKHLNGTSTLQSLQSLYNRATKAFVQRNFALTYSLLESAFAMLPPPIMPSQDPLSSHRRKWDVLRITLEATMFTGSGVSKEYKSQEDRLPATLKSLLELPPPQFATRLHTRSLLLFTPSALNLPPSSGFVPSQIVVTLMLASLKVQCPDIGRVIAEDWLARRGQVDLSIPQDEAKEGYGKVIETYCLHILPRLKDWDFAEDFLKFNEELDPARKKQLLGNVLDLRKESETRPPSPSITPTPQISNLKLNGNGYGISQHSFARTPERSPSPSPSTSSLSTTSTHTAVPVAPAQAFSANGSITPISRASTITPLATKHTDLERGTRLRQQQQQSRDQFSEPWPYSTTSHPPSAPSIDDRELDRTKPNVMTVIRRVLAPHLTLPKIAMTLLVIILPLLSFVYKLRARRRRGLGLTATKPSGLPDPVVQARQRLQTFRSGSILFKAWHELRLAIKDTVMMAGQGLV